MTPVRQTLTALRPLLIAGLALAVVALGAPGSGFAAECIDAAAADVGTSPPLNCTANDVTIALIQVDEIVEPCSGPGDTADVRLRAQIESGAQERYDPGFFIAVDGGDARTGECVRGFLTPVTSDPGAVVAGDTNTGGGPFIDLDGDACGDITAGAIYFRDVMDLDPITIVCNPSSDDPTRVAINACISWDHQTMRVCTDQDDTGPRTKAKCNCSTLTIDLPVGDPAPAIDVRKLPDTQFVQVGGDAVFTIEVQNIGDTDLLNVVVDDALCDTLTGPEGDDGSDGILSADPGDLLGETWTYICTVEDVLASFTNSVTVTADIFEDTGTVTDTDTAVAIVVSDIPTVSGWGLAGLALLLGGLAFLALRRRRAA